MLAIVFLLFFQANAGYQDLSTDLWLNWTYPDPTSIYFVVGVNSAIYSDTKWVGIGLKSADGPLDMSDADIVTFYMGSVKSCQDRYSSLSNGYPPIDSIQNFNCSDRQLVGNTYLFSWKRPLNSNYSLDMALTMNERVMVIWAHGPMSSGDIAYHGNSNRGHQIVFLQESYNNGLLSYSGIIFLSVSLINII